jgi:hypothetical protein
MYLDCNGCFYIITVAFLLGLGFTDIIILLKSLVWSFVTAADIKIFEEV